MRSENRRVLSYRQRMTLAIACSLVLHATALSLRGCGGKPGQVLALREEKPPVVLNVAPVPPERPLHLVDAIVPAQAEVSPDTDLIALQASNAQDESDSEGDARTPDFGRVGESEELAAPAPPAQEARLRDPKPVKPVQEEVAESPPPKTDTNRDESSEIRIEEAPAEAEPKPEETPVQVAQAEPESPESLRPGLPQTRVEGGVKSKGILGFEAQQHEMAPYLKEIRDRVERNWRRALHLRFTGASPTKAVLDCVITPDGKVDSVTIVEPGDSASYAYLCKEAVERAGPFGPFPFETPSYFREKNIEIRWTFSYLTK